MMHLLPILSLAGTLLALLGVAQLVPMGVSLAFNEPEWRVFLLTALGTSVIGISLFLTARGSKDINERDGFLVVTLGWLAAAVCGAVPYLATGSVHSSHDAFFESMSGFTTTGASILTDLSGVSHGLLIWRSMTQWFGGMGIIVLALVILPALGIGGMQLYKREVPGPYSEKITPRLADTARALWSIYILLTVVLVLVLRWLDLSWFEAVNHALTTIATAGFSTRNDSIGGFASPSLEWVLMVFMLLSGMNYFLHYRLLFRPGSRLGFLRDVELRWYLGTGVLVTLGVALHLFAQKGYPAQVALTKAAFQVTSLLTTTGFTSDDYGSWGVGWQVILLLLMFTGGCAGSTSGGIKWVRVILVIKFIRLELMRLIHPRLVIHVKLNTQLVSPEILANILAFMFLYVSTFGVLTALFAFDGASLATAAGAAASAVGNIGPGLDQVGPAGNYAHFSPFSKWVMSLGMLLGRLELMTVFVFFMPSLWRS